MGASTGMPDFEGPEQAFHWYLHRKDAGEVVELAELAERYPAWQAELARLDSDWRRLEEIRRELGLAGDAQAGTGTAGPSPESSAWRSETTRRVLQRLVAHAPRHPRYQIRERIDGGGMGEIFDAWDEDLHRGLAMKVMRGDKLRELAITDRPQYENFLNRFLEEAQVTAQLNHPGVVPVHDVGLDADGRVYFTMARVQGHDLRWAFERHAEGDPEWSRMRLLNVLVRVCETMAYAHSRGCVHRDLKPANVMVGEFGEVYVMDWGLSLLSGASAETTEGRGVAVNSDRRRELGSDPESPLATRVLTGGNGETSRVRQPGTIYYMAPEQAAGRVSEMGPRADVYAVGAMLYHLITGRVPHRRDPDDRSIEEILEHVVAGKCEPLADLARQVSPELISITEKAMAVRLDERYTDMEALGGDLRAYLEGRAVEAHATGPVVELRKWVGRNRLAAAAIGSVLVAIVGGTLSTNVVQAAAAKERENHQGELLSQARAEQARLHLASARELSQRGSWENVLADLRAAETAGYPDDIELSLHRIQAWTGLGRRSEMRQELDVLLARDDLAERHGLVLLADADARLSEFGSHQEVVQELHAAIRNGLPEAEERYARALLVPSTADAISGMRSVLEVDPHHYGARSHLLTLLIFFGDIEQLTQHATAFTVLYPEDVTGPLAQALALAMDGRREESRAIAEGAVGALEPKYASAVRALLDGFIVVRALAGPSVWLGGMPELDASRQAIQEADPALLDLMDLDQGASALEIASVIGLGRARLLTRVKEKLAILQDGTQDGTLTLTTMNHPALANGIARVAQGLNSMTENRWAEAYEHFAAAKRFHPEGFTLYCSATAVLDSDLERIEKMHQAEELYMRAARTPSFLSFGVARAGRYWALHCQHELLTKHGAGEDIRERFRETLTWFSEMDEPAGVELTKVCTLAFEAGEYDLARELTLRWIEAEPRSIDPWLRMATQQLFREDPVGALESVIRAEGLAKGRRNREKVAEIRAEVLAAEGWPEDLRLAIVTATLESTSDEE